MPEDPPPLTVGTPNHYALQTDDVEKTVSFYEKILGFKQTERPFDGRFGGAWLAHPNNEIMVHVIQTDFWQSILHLNPNAKKLQELAPRKALDWKGRPTDMRLAGEDHMSFPVKDFQKATETLKQHGVEFTATKEKQGWFLDPDGRTIEFGEYGPTPPFKTSKM